MRLVQRFIIASVLVLTGCVGFRIHKYDSNRLTIKEETENIPFKIPSGHLQRVTDRTLKIKRKLRLALKVIGRDCFIIPAKVNGVRAYFTIDTGSQVTIINPILAEKSNVVLRKSEDKYRVQLVRQFPDIWAQAYKATLPVIQIGSFQISKLPVLVSMVQADVQVVFLRLLKKSGLLGLDVLSNFSILFDYRQNYVRFYDKAYDSKEERYALPFSLKRGKRKQVRVFVECRICGHDLEGMLDTGASGEISLPREIWDLLGLAGKKYTGSIIVGDKEIEKVRFVLQENDEDIVIPFHILRKLGYDLLILDFFSSKIYLDKGDMGNE